jgi:hypothetical protein
MTRPLLAIAFLLSTGALAQTPEDWIRLGEQVHGGFGTLIPLGMRIGLDARERLGAAPRELDVTYLDGTGTPCPCVADGILMATSASPGQGTLRVAAEKAPAGYMGEAIIRHRKTGAQLRYRIPAPAYSQVLSWNKGRSPRERYAIVMQSPAASLFSVE